MTSLVSVICICYNHEKFVEEAISSVLQQSHQNIEFWIIDNGSTDKCAEKIGEAIRTNPQIKFINHPQSIGYTQAFNQVFFQTKGDFIIDLAADDILLPNRIEEGIKDFALSGKSYGVHFSDGLIIDESGMELSLHSDRFPHHSIPQGNVYKDVIERYFILTPSMMMRSSVLKQLNGYDENLAFEDFDFWVRSARITQYLYSPKVLVKKRLVAKSMSAQQYRHKSLHLFSTLKVCQKAFFLNQTLEENRALRKRIVYEAFQAFKVGRLDVVVGYLILFFKTI